MYTYTLEISNTYERFDIHAQSSSRDWEALCAEVSEWLAVNYPSCMVCRIYAADGCQLGRIDFLRHPAYNPDWKKPAEPVAETFTVCRVIIEDVTGTLLYDAEFIPGSDDGGEDFLIFHHWLSVEFGYSVGVIEYEVTR